MSISPGEGFQPQPQPQPPHAHDGATPAVALLTPARIRALLDEHGLAPSRRLGQNFVVDANTVRKMVRDAGVTRGDVVAEVGPGLGSLTLALVEAGARVVAVEVDRGLAATLATVLGDAGAADAVEILHADALEVAWDRLVPPGAAMVANLPYNVATPIVVTALASGAFGSLHVMVQREVGERWCAAPGDARYGAVSVKLAALADARMVAAVPRTAFHPVPRVDSVAVSLTARPRMHGPARDAFFVRVEQGFGQRRKRLRNSLAADGTTPARVERALAATGLDVGARAEELDLQAWIRLHTALTVPER